MPKATEKSNKIVYPPGCKEISEDLNKDELIKRLKVRIFLCCSTKYTFDSKDFFPIAATVCLISGIKIGEFMNDSIPSFTFARLMLRLILNVILIVPFGN